MNPEPGNSTVPPAVVSSPQQKRASGRNVGVAAGLAILGWVLGIGMTLAAIFGHASRHDNAIHINEVIYGPFFLLFAVVMTAVVYRTEHPSRARWQPEIERDRWLRNRHQIYGIAVPLFFAAAVWGAFALIGL